MTFIGKCAAFGALLAMPVAVHSLPPAGGAPGPAEVHVKVSHLRSAKGAVLACLTADPQRFPRCTDDGRAKRVQISAAHVNAIVFRDIKPGRYAIALLHDENGNGKADRAMAMIPREGFGFSRDAKVKMGPPRFDEAAFPVKQGDTSITITMRYML